MRKFVFGILIGIGVVGLVGFLYWRYGVGLRPAVMPPPEDIVKLINADKNSIAKNTTGMPLNLPAGFSISIFAQDLGKPRVLALDPSGRLLVSVPDQGKVLALPDEDVDGVADRVITTLVGLNRPHGLAIKCKGSAGVRECSLYVAETSAVSVYRYDEATARATDGKKIIDLPGGGNHFTRTILFLPPPNEDKLLISVGSTCNVCQDKDWRRAKILVANADGTNLQVYATGLRNSVFMTTHPETKETWATEMGRDWLGDDLPPDEVNIIGRGPSTSSGQEPSTVPDYGWPFCYGKGIQDKKFDTSTSALNRCRESISSFIDIPAHSAPLGLAFIPKDEQEGKFGKNLGWPREYWNNLLVAFHGSWNRSVPTGYKIVRYKLDEQGNYLEEDFITGWLTEKGALGRPVDILALPGGITYISDDKAGVIYRLVYQP